MRPKTESEADVVRVWIIEDDADYRQSLVFLLDNVSGMRCTELFVDFEEVECLVEDGGAFEEPDIVLMDFKLPGVDGVEGVERLKAHLPGVPVLMLTLNDTPEVIFRALQAGASGYLLKSTPLDRMLEAIREAVRGGTLLTASVAEKVLRFFTASRPEGDYGLTEREQEILQCMCDGHGQKQIAALLHISPHTVDNHLRSIYHKLHVNSGLAAVSKALSEGIVRRMRSL